MRVCVDQLLFSSPVPIWLVRAPKFDLPRNNQHPEKDHLQSITSRSLVGSRRIENPRKRNRNRNQKSKTQQQSNRSSSSLLPPPPSTTNCTAHFHHAIQFKKKQKGGKEERRQIAERKASLLALGSGINQPIHSTTAFNHCIFSLLF